MNCQCVVWINRSDATEAEFWKAAKNDSNFFCFGQNFNASSLKKTINIFLQKRMEMFLFTFLVLPWLCSLKDHSRYGTSLTHMVVKTDSLPLCV